jgi:hypothetical protein
MAEILDRMPIWVRQGRREQFPYDEWLDGQVWMLTRGVDFAQERRSMGSRIRHAALKRGIDVSVGHRELPNGTEILVVGPKIKANRSDNAQRKTKADGKSWSPHTK